MSAPASQGKMYYLGVNGEQLGPLSEQAVLQKIKATAVTAETLIWYDGLEDWLPISTVSPFKEVFEVQTRKAPAPEASPKKRSSPKSQPGKVDEFVEENSASHTFAAKDGPVDTIFKGEEGVFSRPRFIETRVGIMLICFTALSLVGVLVFIAFSSSSPAPPSPQAQGRKFPKKITRDDRLRKALSELAIKSRESLTTLEGLIAENPNDEVATRALDGAINYYRRNRKAIEAGNLLMKANQPLKASEFYLKDPPNFALAERAIFEAHKIEKNPTKKFELLIQDISILLGPLNQRELATNRIGKLAQEFPGKPHPYQYYLKSPSNRITDIFQRLSAHFSQNLEKFIEVEFPELTLAKSPLIELKRIGGQSYRIAASFKGNVVLDRDTLQNISLEFWNWEERWFLVRTNLTPQRSEWAQQERARLQSKTLGPDDMILQLEQLFSTLYPKKALHEIVSQ